MTPISADSADVNDGVRNETGAYLSIGGKRAVALSFDERRFGPRRLR